MKTGVKLSTGKRVPHNLRAHLQTQELLYLLLRDTLPLQPQVSKEKADQKPAHSAGSWGLHYGLASCSSLGPQGHSEQAGGQTLSQNPLSTHDLDSLNPSSYLNLLPFFNGMKATNMRNLRAFVPDLKCFLQQFPAAFWELCCHQGSWLIPLIKWGRNSQQSTCTVKGH